MKAIKRLRMLLDEAWAGPLKLQTARYPDHPNQVHIVRECNGVILAVVDAPGSRGTALAEVFADGSTLLPALLDVAEAAKELMELQKKANAELMLLPDALDALTEAEAKLDAALARLEGGE